MSYPKDTKIALVKEYEQGKTVATISTDSGIPENSIYRWIREYHTINTTNTSFTPSDHLEHSDARETCDVQSFAATKRMIWSL